MTLFLARYWKLIGVGVLVVALAVTVGLLRRSDANLKTARAALLNPATGKTWQSEAMGLYRDLEICKGNTLRLETAVASQNAATEAMRAESDARAKMLADGLQQARRGRAGAEARASALLTHPPVGIDACARAEAARDAVIRSLGR